MNAPAPKRELKVVCLTTWGFKAFPCEAIWEGQMIAESQASFKWWIIDSAGVLITSSDDEQN